MAVEEKTEELHTVTFDLTPETAIAILERSARVEAAQAAANAAAGIAQQLRQELDQQIMALRASLQIPPIARCQIDPPSRTMVVQWIGPADGSMAFKYVSPEMGGTPLNLMSGLDEPDISAALTAQLEELNGAASVALSTGS